MGDGSEAIPEKVNEANGAFDHFLGNETGLNYVIDPWTRNKNSQGLTDNLWANLTIDADRDINVTANRETKLSYINHYVRSNTQPDLNAFWGNVEGIVNLSDGYFSSPCVIGYPQENTVSASNSMKGFATGALFRATYFPSYWMAFDETRQEVTDEAVFYSETINKNTAGVDFYLWNGQIYKDYIAIFNTFAIHQQEASTEQKLLYANFTASLITTLGKQAFKGSSLAQYAASDPTGYMSYLLTKCGDTPEDSEMFNAEDAIENYLTNHPETVARQITYYQEGVCFYPYWIRHMDNNDPIKMGIMEFAIVRNNVYDLAVKSIGSLGYAGTEIPTPGEDVESNKLQFNVTIQVKDWVVRQNTGIIF